MLPKPATDAVERLIASMSNEPTRLPLAEMAAVHHSGHDVRIDATGQRVVALVSRRRDDRLATLTPREQQVATVLAAGYTNHQIAVALGISVATVKDHVHAILAKTGFESRSQLTAAWYGGLSS